MPEKFNHALDKPASGAIHAEEKNSEKCYGDNHDPGCDKNFSPRRPGYLAHFDANFMQKAAPLAGIFAYFFEGRGYRIPATNTATNIRRIILMMSLKHCPAIGLTSRKRARAKALASNPKPINS